MLSVEQLLLWRRGRGPGPCGVAQPSLRLPRYVLRFRGRRRGLRGGARDGRLRTAGTSSGGPRVPGETRRKAAAAAAIAR